MLIPPQFSYEPPPGDIDGCPSLRAPSAANSSHDLAIDGRELDVRRLRRRPGVFVIPRSKLIRIVKGTPDLTSGELLSFNSTTEVVLIMRHARRRLAISVLNGWIQIWKIRGSATDPTIDLPKLTIRAWTHRVSCPPWLSTMAIRLASSDSVLDRVASVGILGRLWAPPDGNYAPLTSQLRRWSQTLSDATVHGVRELALQRVAEITEELGTLTSLGDDPAAAETAHWIVDSRDILESVAWPLGVRGHARAIDHALRELDRDIALRWSHLDDLFDLHGPALSHPHWRAVGWQEPQAWWGGSDV